MTAKTISGLLLLSMISAFSAIGVYKLFEGEPKVVTIQESQPVQFANFNPNPAVATPKPVDFTAAAEATTEAVVHIKTTYLPKQNQQQNPWSYFFGDDFFQSPYGNGYNQPKVASGSGVIISHDGYIVTNNHVVDKGDKVEVILHDKRSIEAEVIGTDPSTDLALIKIAENELPHVTFGNSDEVRVGEWVLAVGNPFNLASTVTAGIVSAKARNINILKDKFAVESFIQTDAAVNQGNSGGALVNTSGELIGINTAIATPTGTYAGYAFAVPVNIVRKVVADLRDFGKVQRGFLGVTIKDVNAELAEELKLDHADGVYIQDVLKGSAANDGGMKSGDVVQSIGNSEVKSIPELQEQLARHRPGDNLRVGIIRDGKPKTLFVQLKNEDGNTSLINKEETPAIGAMLGADLRELTADEKDKLAVNGGVMISKLTTGKLRQYTKIREGFIITKVDKQEIKSIQDLEVALQEKKDGGVMLEGIYPDYPGVHYYAFAM